MKKWLPVAILFVLLVSGFFFWSLGSIAKEAPAKIVLAAAQGDVQVKPSGSDAWSAAATGQELSEGTSVRTIGSDARATIRFFDRSESRLGPDTILVLDRASKTIPTNESDIKLKLESGRVWSRVLRLLDLDGGFSVGTNDVVATVRGTAFDLEKNANTGTMLWVTQSVVETSAEPAATRPSTTSKMLAEGFMKRFGKGVATDRESITAQALSNDWTKENQAKDQAFLQNFVGKGTISSSLMDGLARWSERLHVRFASENDRRELDARYLERRLERLRVLADKGQIGEASKQFIILEDEVRARLAGKDADAWRPTMKATVFRAWLAFDDIKPDQEAYRLKQRLEDLLLSTAGAPDERVYLRMLGLDARLDEAFAALSLGDEASVTQNVNLVTQGLDNTAREIKQASDTIGAAHIAKLWIKLEAEQARLDALRLRLSQIKFVPIPTAPSATSTGALPPVTPPKMPTSTPITPPPTNGLSYDCRSLAVFAQPNPVDVDGKATLYAQATKADGATADVTASAAFKTIGSLGTLNGNIFTANAAGSMQIQGSVTCNGQAVSGQMSIQINAGPVVPRSLSISASPLTLAFFERSTLSAVLTYSNGVTKNVSASASYQSSNPSIGMVSSNIFSSGQTAGSAVVTGTYTENGITLNDSLTISVVDRATKP